MTAPILQLPSKVLRSATAGRRPGDGTFRALTDGELFLNTQDKVLCFLNAAGALVAFPLDPAALAALAPLASPALTGQPTAPSPASTDNSQQVTNTSWVRAFISSLSSTVKPLVDGVAATGTSTLFARADHVHPTDASRAAKGANGDITSLSALSTPLSVAQGGTGSTTAAGARSDLGAAAAGANGDITALSGLTTALSVGQGGTGSSTASGARSGIGAAASGANGDITSLAGLTSRPTWAGYTPFDTGNVTLSKAANGYVKLPDGLMIQWGVAGGTASGNNSTSFNVGFPSASCMVVATSTLNATGSTVNACAVAVQSHDTGGFQWTSRYYNGGFNADNNSVNWIAIGY